MYVWFDALINYISTLGWPEDEKTFNEFWPGVQIAGKDNLRQQSAMWQAMLMSAGLPPSKQIYIEGFITSGGQKMSKSLGNVIDPFELTEKYGIDPVRYYLLREIPSYDDGDFSLSRFKELYNADLANSLGNLVARAAKLCEKSNQPIKRNHYEISAPVKTALEKYKFDEALKDIFLHIDRANQTISQTQPWAQEGEELAKSLEAIISFIDYLVPNLQPFMPGTAEKILEQFKGPKIKAGSPLFPRI